MYVPNPNYVAVYGGAAPFEGQLRPLCDSKLIHVQNGQSYAPNFLMYTDVPLATKFSGYATDDISVSTNKLSTGIGEVQPPEEAGLEVVGYELKAGECGFHNALLWHASGPNTSENPRRGFIPRYVAGGTMWLGELRFPYNFTDAELECAPGDPIHGPHFPRIEAAF